LILDAWAVLAERDVPPSLTMIGVSGANRDRLRRMIDERSLGGLVALAPFLPDDEFRLMLTSASYIVFPSDFEGFGLPVVEGMALGKPVVIGPEQATMEVAGGHAVVMSDWTADALADAMTAASQLDDADLESARSWGTAFTWARTVGQTRDMLNRIAVSRS